MKFTLQELEQATKDIQCVWDQKSFPGMGNESIEMECNSGKFKFCSYSATALGGPYAIDIYYNHQIIKQIENSNERMNAIMEWLKYLISKTHFDNA